MLKKVLLIILFFGLISHASAEQNITAGICVNLTTSNDNGSVTYWFNGTIVTLTNASPLTICGLHNITQQVFEKNVSAGDIYFNETSQCKVNITVNPQRVCSHSADISPGSSFDYTDNICDIHISATAFSEDQCRNITCPQIDYVNYSWIEYLTGDGNSIKYYDNQGSDIIDYPYSIMLDGVKVPNTFEITIPRTFTCPKEVPTIQTLQNANLSSCYQFFGKFNTTDINAFAFTKWINCENTVDEKTDLLLACQNEKTLYESDFNQKNTLYNACVNNMSFYTNRYNETNIKYQQIQDELLSVKNQLVIERNNKLYAIITTNLFWVGLLIGLFLVKRYFDNRLGWFGK